MFKDRLYTRQDISSRTGLSDDVLSFWSKQGLLRSSQGGGGAGQHRRYDFIQVQLAAILGELRKHGANVGALRSFAGLVHHAAWLGSEWSLSGWNLYEAAEGADHLLAFRAGKEVQIFDKEANALRPVTSDEEALDAGLSMAEGADRSILERAARSLQSNDILPARLYRDLTTDENFRRSSDENWSGEWVWTLALDDVGEWHVRAGDEDNVRFPDGLHEVNSYIVLRISKIIRELWADSREATEDQS